jgi:hypothetical protein
MGERRKKKKGASEAMRRRIQTSRPEEGLILIEIPDMHDLRS